MPLIDSGVAGYFWTGPRFLSIVLYTCKGFDDAAAIAFTRDYFRIEANPPAGSATITVAAFRITFKPQKFALVVRVG